MTITVATRPLRVPNEDETGGVRRSPPAHAPVTARDTGGGPEHFSDRPYSLLLGAVGPVIGMIASTTLRNLALIALAILLILVILPAALSAQWASAG